MSYNLLFEELRLMGYWVSVFQVNGFSFMFKILRVFKLLEFRVNNFLTFTSVNEFKE